MMSRIPSHRFSDNDNVRSTKLRPRRLSIRANRHKQSPVLENLEQRALLSGTPSIYTVTNVNDTGPGSLRQAIAQANADPNTAGSQIQFGSLFDGSQPLTITLLSGELELKETAGPETIIGPEAGLTVRNNNMWLGNQLATTYYNRVFEVDDQVEASISGLTITGGAPIQGSGGGVLVQLGGTLTMSGCTLSGNYAAGGGEGGGLRNSGTATLIDCTISGNVALASGGIENGGTLTMTNCTVYGNSSNYWCAINNIGNITITNSTISGNRGGGIRSAGQDTTLNNTIVAGNGPDITGDISSNSAYNLIGDGIYLTGIVNGVQGNIVGTASSPIDPKLGPLANNGGLTATLAPLQGSPAIDAGSTALAIDPSTGQPLQYDQRGVGFPRESGNSVDIGAFESHSVTSTLVVDPASATYGGTTTLTATLTANGQPLVGLTVDFHLGNTDLGTAQTDTNGVATLSAASIAGIGAGTHLNDITANYAGSVSYWPANASATLTVTPAALKISVNDATKLYGAALPAFSASYSGFLNGDTPSSLTTKPTFSTSASDASPVGTYSITASGAVDPNYTITYAPGTLSVTPAPLKISANDATKIYGAQLPTLTASYSGFVNGDSPASLTTAPTLTTTVASNKPVGDYAIVVAGAVDPNYTISYVQGILSITPASLKISANDATKVYGAQLPTLTASYSGFVNGDSPASLTTAPKLTTTATSNKPVGKYAITVSGAVDPNYTISYVQGALSITPASLKISANDATKAYGAAVPTLTASYSGFVNGDTPASLSTQVKLSTTATAASHVGAYVISASEATDPNYKITFDDGTLDITKAILTITANNLTVPFGGNIPTLTAHYSGFVNGDSPASLSSPPVLSTTATNNSPAGSYPITVSGAKSPDYAINFVAGTLTVQPYVLPSSPRGRNEAEFVITLFREILGRGVDPQGLQFWMARLSAGESQLRVALTLWTSPERIALNKSGQAPTIPFATAFTDAVRAGRQAARNPGGTSASSEKPTIQAHSALPQNQSSPSNRVGTNDLAAAAWPGQGNNPFTSFPTGPTRRFLHP